jgi:hypothetical protein
MIRGLLRGISREGPLAGAVRRSAPYGSAAGLA